MGYPGWVLGLLFGLYVDGTSGAEPGERLAFRASDGARLSYLAAGQRESPRLVLVPGWMCPARIWAPQIEHWRSKYRVLALDPRAQGMSERQVEDLTPERRARDIRELLAHEQGTRMVLVGWSMAVGEALSYTEQFGTGTVSALVLVDGFVGREPTKESILGRQAWLSGLLTNRADFTTAFLKMFFREPPPAGWMADLRIEIERTPAAAAFTLATVASLRDHRPALAALDRPVLYVHQPMLAAEAQVVSQTLPGAEVVALENVGHALFVERPTEFHRIVDGFLERRVGRGSEGR